MEKIILKLLDVEIVQHIVRFCVLAMPVVLWVIASELASRI